VSISSPSDWRLHIHNDGSANLRYGADMGHRKSLKSIPVEIPTNQKVGLIRKVSSRVC
jgi:hypothetical protein